MAIDNNFIDELKAKINIVDVIGRDVELKRAGSNYKGLCPFHNEKTPSFTVSEQKQIFNCFGCGEKGDVIHFVQKKYNLTFMEAVEKICEDNGIEMPAHGSRPKRDLSRFYDINTKAARFFYNNIKIAGNPGYAYIKKRGLSADTITKCGIGYSKDSWNSLYDYLHKEKVSDEDMMHLGLINKGKNGYYDKFRNRLIFPIFNPAGKVIGFGGRALANETPKYLNSAESEVFLKKNNLYGLNFSKASISELDFAILVEGYMDAISLMQSGIKNVVASCGTALTDNQARLLCRYSKNIVISYDSDSAGVNAAIRGIDIIRKAGGNVRILHVSDGKDPDEFVKHHGREAFEKLIKNAIPGTEFKLNALEKEFNLDDDQEKITFLERVVTLLKGLSPIERNLYAKKISEKYDISERVIENEVNTGAQEVKPDSKKYDTKSRVRELKMGPQEDIKVELLILGIVVLNMDFLSRLSEDKIEFRTEVGNKIESALTELNSKDGYGEPEQRIKYIYDYLNPDEEKIVKTIWDKARVGPDDEEYYKECISSYRHFRSKEKKIQLLNELSVAEQMQDVEKMREIAAKIMVQEEINKK